MDGRRRAIDNIYIERFWRLIKYEKIYLKLSNGGVDLRNIVAEYMDFYNMKEGIPKVEKFHLMKCTIRKK